MGKHRSVEQALGGRVFPIRISTREAHAREMASDAGHSHGTAAPWLAKVEIKRVVLDVLGPRVMLVWY